jgi:glycosyltransferase 2 family protein
VTPRPRLKALARVAVAATILGYLFSRIPASEVSVALGSATPGLLAMAVLAALAGQLAVADRLRRLVEGLGSRATTAELLQIDLAARFYGLVLPAGNLTGVLARFYQIARRDGAYAATAVALALERLIATLTLCGVGVLFWLLELPTGTWPALLLMLGALLGLLALQALLFVDLPLPARLAAWRPPRLASLYAALGRARRLPRALLTRVLLLGVVVHLIGVGAFVLVAAALELELSYLTIGWTRSAAILVAILPVSLAGLGLREGAFVLLLAPYGIAPADALAYSLLAFATTVLAIGLMGGVIEAFRLLR